MEIYIFIAIAIVSFFAVIIAVVLLSKTPYNPNLQPKNIDSLDIILHTILSEYYYRIYLSDKEQNLNAAIKHIQSKIKFVKIIFIFRFLLKKYNEKNNEYNQELEKITNEIDNFKMTIPADYTITKNFNAALSTLKNEVLDTIFGIKVKGLVWGESFFVIYNKYFFLIKKENYEILKTVKISDCNISVNYDRKVEYRLGKKGVTVSYTWEHVRKDGLPDKRFSYNSKLLINRYYYYELSKFNFKVYDYQKNVEEIDEKYNQMKSDVIQSEQNGILLIEYIKYSKSYSKYCIMFDNKYYPLVSIDNSGFVIFKEDKNIIIPFSSGLIDDIKKYNDYLEKISSYRQNVGKHILYNYNLYTIIDFVDSKYVVEDAQKNRITLSTDLDILSEYDYQHELLKVQYKDILDNINICRNDIYETYNYGRIRIVEVLDKKLNIRHSFDQSLLIDKDDFKLDIISKNCMKIENPTEFSLGDYVYYKPFGLFKIVDIGDSMAQLKKKKKKAVKVILEKDLYIFDKVQLSYNIEDLKTNILIRDTRGNYGIVSSIASTIKMWILDSHETKDINYWDCYLVDYDDVDFLNYLEQNKTKVPRIFLANIVLNKDMYYFQDYKKTIKKWFGETIDVSNFEYNVIIFGKGKVALRSKFKDFSEYLISYSEKNDFYDYEYSLESREYDYSLSKCEKKYVLVKLNDYRYITTKKLKELNIDKNDINNFIRKLKSYLAKNYFVSIDLIKNEFDFKLLDLFQSDSHLLNFIKKCGFTSYKFAGADIITLNSSGYKQEIFEKAIIEVLKEQGLLEIDEYDLFNMLNEKMGFKFDIDSFEFEANKFTELFFSPELEKVYLNKEDYYKELYNE